MYQYPPFSTLQHMPVLADQVAAILSLSDLNHEHDLGFITAR